MKTIDGKIVDVAYYIDNVIYDGDTQYVIVSETRNNLDHAYYSSIAAIRARYHRARISLVVDDYGGDKVFTLSRLKEWVNTLNSDRYAEAISALERWCDNE